MKRFASAICAALWAALLLPARAITADATVSGKLVETMDAGGYTYALLDTGTGRTWIASKPFKAAIGEKVSTGGGYEMKDFASPTLGRTFPSIYFVTAVALGTNALPPQGLPAGHGAMMGGHGAMPRSGGTHGADSTTGPGLSGEVVETMDAGVYTYVKVKGATETIWAATEKTEIKIGEKVTVPPGELMKNFTSTKLNRTFDQIYFVGSLLRAGEKPATGGAKRASAREDAPPPLAAPIVQPAGAIGIAQIIARKAELAGKSVTVKGQITKFTQRIMGRNWMHITDGGGTDLTVTSDSYATVGDIVVASGTLVIDQDFGHGYSYPVLLEKATITK